MLLEGRAEKSASIVMSDSSSFYPLNEAVEARNKGYLYKLS